MNAETKMETFANNDGSGIYEERLMNAKEIEARKCLDAGKMYMNPETGSVDTGEGWIQDCTNPDYGFPCEELARLYEVRKPVTAEERREWGDWVPVD